MCVAAEHHARSWAQQYDLLASVLTRTVGGTVAAHTVHVEVILLAVFPVGTNGRISGSLSVLWKLTRLPYWHCRGWRRQAHVRRLSHAPL